MDGFELDGRDAEKARILALIASDLARLGPDVPPGFAEALFGRVSAEDLGLYPPAALAGFARSAYEHLAEPRLPGREEIRLSDAAVEVDGRRLDLTVLEVINDNMPFLLDSTLAELTERGLVIRFVAHPILAVERDAEGRLRRVLGEAQAGGQQGARRESFIHLHLDRLDAPEARAALVQGLAKFYADVWFSVKDWAPIC